MRDISKEDVRVGHKIRVAKFHERKVLNARFTEVNQKEDS